MNRLRWLAISVLFSVVARGQTTASRPTVAAATYEISGIAVDAVRNQPLAHADIQILSAQGGDPLQRMVTASDGRFRFVGLPAEKYQLIGEAHGYLRQGLDQHEGYFTGVVTGPGQVSTGILLRLPPEASISGRVADTFGDPVPDADVTLFHRGLINGSVTTSYYADTRANDLGEYRFGKLIPGTYFVAVTAKPWYAMHFPRVGGSSRGDELNVAYPTTFYDNIAQPEAALPIALRAGDEAITNFTLSAERATRIVLHTADASVGVVQTLLGGYENAMNGQFEERRIDEHTTEIAGLPAGQFRVDVTPYGERNEGARSLNFDMRGDVVVDAGDVSQAPAIRVLRGTVKDETVAGNLTVTLRERSSGDGYSAGVQPDGTFFLSNLPAGLYDVATFGSDAYVSRISATGAEMDGQSVEIADAGDVRLTLELKHDPAEIPGTVLDGDKPVAGTMVLLISDQFPRDTGLMRRDQSDSDGTFTLRGVVPGRYTIMAIKGGWDLEWLNPEVIKPYLAEAQHIEVLPKGKREVKVKMQGVEKVPE